MIGLRRGTFNTKTRALSASKQWLAAGHKVKVIYEKKFKQWCVWTYR